MKVSKTFRQASSQRDSTSPACLFKVSETTKPFLRTALLYEIEMRISEFFYFFAALDSLVDFSVVAFAAPEFLSSAFVVPSAVFLSASVFDLASGAAGVEGATVVPEVATGVGTFTDGALALELAGAVAGLGDGVGLTTGVAGAAVGAVFVESAFFSSAKAALCNAARQRISINGRI